MRKLVLAGLLGAASIFSTACSDVCESSANRIKDRQEKCGATVQAGGSDSEEAECTDSLATSYQNLADCIEKASCSQVKDDTWSMTCAQ